jgi:hypothetical protein
MTWGRVPRLSIIFWEILSLSHGNFEQQNKVLDYSIIIIIIIITYYNLYIH